MPIKTLCKISYIRSPSDDPALFAAYDLWLQSFHECELGICGRVFPGHLYTTSRPRGQLTPAGQPLVAAVWFSQPRQLKGKTGYNRLADKVCRIYRDQNTRGQSIKVDLTDSRPQAWQAFQQAIDAEILPYMLSASPVEIAPPPPGTTTKSLLKQVPGAKGRRPRLARPRRAVARKSR